MPNLTTPFFRVSYPNVFKPKLNTLSKQEEYSLVALFAKDANLKPLIDAANAALVAKFGPTEKWSPKLKEAVAAKWPFKEQGKQFVEDKATGQLVVDQQTGKPVLKAGYQEGCYFMNLKSKNKPPIIDQAKLEIWNPTQFYAGCWARAIVSVYAYDRDGGRGVAFGLQALQKWKDDDALGNRVDVQKDFSAIELPEGGGNASAASLFG